MGKKPLFTLAGIPVRVQPWFFAVILFLGALYAQLGWIYVVSWVVIATISITVHEFGHAFAFRGFGLRPSITLHGMGGLTSASTAGAEDTFTPAKSIVTSLAGPLSALVLLGIPAWIMAKGRGFDPGLGFTISHFGTNPTEIVLQQLVFINVGWSLLNLIPVLPLDGGNIMASVGELVAPHSGRRIANIASIAIAVTFGIWGWSNRLYIAPLFAAMFIGMNVMELTNTRHEDADRELAGATRALIDYEPMKAEQLTWSVLTQSPTGERYRWATELTAWARLARGDLRGAHAAIHSLAANAGPSASLLGALALAEGRTDEGVSTLAWSFMHDDHKPAKVLGAMAAAQSGQVVPVTNELLRSGEAGAQACQLFQGLLDYAGHRPEARQVAEVVNAGAHRPPGW